MRSVTQPTRSSTDFGADQFALISAGPRYQRPIFDIPTDGETRLALDANRPDFHASGPPRFFLWTQDIAATVRHLEDLGTKITSDVEDIGSAYFVQFEDPDGNPLMVCQRR